ncbi:unnamed protein product [Acanthoscelides obtectus]|uniref:Uncharacterized protein n=1 Tax=Acanthoscelides obtectus TaxID=200917 RepID=A0A9P0L7D9_ACAOB|nr:unnamed protein product [Acanthoscelides obtectus]CAK1638853.1 hypothetical protein AOBTE_LOCUS10851 [Acanthoscelides obtectus]
MLINLKKKLYPVKIWNGLCKLWSTTVSDAV